VNYGILPKLQGQAGIARSMIACYSTAACSPLDKGMIRKDDRHKNRRKQSMSGKNLHTERGFTLIEMIGVLAVIAILAAVVAPKVFDAIKDSKITSAAEDIATLRTNVTSFFRDTGQWPIQDGTNSDLIRNRTTPIKGWKGPYMDKNLVNPILSGGTFQVLNGDVAFDIDGDGTNDYTTNNSYVSISVKASDQAKALSNVIDSDGDVTSGKKAWYKAGRVRTSDSKATTTTLYVFLGHF